MTHLNLCNVCAANCPEKALALSQALNLGLIDALPHKKTWGEQMILSWMPDKKNREKANGNTTKKEHEQADKPLNKAQTDFILALLSADSGPVSVDFMSGKKNHRRQFGGGKGQPLARAIGMQQATPPRILDATAGMGNDAFVLATLGCNVLMIERSPIVCALLNDALVRANNHANIDPDIAKIMQRLSLVNADSTHYLRTEKPNVDVIYMDPMYPEKKHKASAKKEMKALQNLLGADMDSAKLLDAALKIAKQRVVVKRPAKAPTIDGIQPNAVINSPNTRYDIYSIKALKAGGFI